jgi:hypothetical protein
MSSRVVLSRDKWFGQFIIYSNIYSPSPCFLKSNAADFRHDVDHHRRRAHAKEVIEHGEVLSGSLWQLRASRA